MKRFSRDLPCGGKLVVVSLGEDDVSRLVAGCFDVFRLVAFHGSEMDVPEHNFGIVFGATHAVVSVGMQQISSTVLEKSFMNATGKPPPADLDHGKWIDAQSHLYKSVAFTDFVYHLVGLTADHVDELRIGGIVLYEAGGVFKNFSARWEIRDRRAAIESCPKGRFVFLLHLNESPFDIDDLLPPGSDRGRNQAEE